MNNERRRDARTSGPAFDRNRRRASDRPPLGAILGPVALLLLIAGCAQTSHRFQTANSNRNTGLGGVAGTKVPPAPTGGAHLQSGPIDQSAYGTPIAAAANAPPNRNPNPMMTGARNERLVTATPRPGARGTTMNLAADGPEIVGRVVNDQGRPEPEASVQVFDVAEPGRLLAQTASDGDGSFRIVNLRPGAQYQVVALISTGGRSAMGQTIVTPPNTNVVVECANPPSSLAPFGSRLSRKESAEAIENSRYTTVGTAPPPRPLPVEWMQSSGVGSVIVRTPRRSQTVSQEPYEGSTDQERFYLPASAPTAAPADAAAPNPAGSFPANQPASRSLNRTPAMFAGSGLDSLRLTKPTGEPIFLGELEGDLVLLDFFGGWCGPCRRSIPHLNELHHRYGQRGLTIVGIDCENGDPFEASRTADQVKRSLGINYRVVSSPLESDCPVRRQFDVRSFPTLVLLDPSGKVLFQKSGADENTLDQLEALIRRQLQ